MCYLSIVYGRLVAVIIHWVFSMVKEEVSIRKETPATAADMLSGSCQAREQSTGSLPALMRIPMQEARFGRSRNTAHQNLDAQSKLDRR